MHICCGHFGCRDTLLEMLQVTDWIQEMINKALTGSLIRPDKEDVGQ
jgi:hypothetical protein